jgi:hypothetical protein
MTLAAPLLIVGHDGGAHVGASLLRAAKALDVPAELVDAHAAYAAPRAIARVNWWLRGRRPTHLRAFGRFVEQQFDRLSPAVMIATGLAPLDASVLRRARDCGLTTVNFLTDDPWSPVSRSQWFLDALPFYDRVFTPRRANMADLRAHGCRFVEYLPFGFDPALFFPEPAPKGERARYAADVFFAGGADADRRPFIAALLAEGFSVSLYGRYWERYPETRHAARGQGSPRELRHAIAAAKICLGLVRRVNRDGHAMRSIEVPAAGGCLLAERTDEHLELFGPDDDAVTYFDDVSSMVRAAKVLAGDEARRHRLAARAHRLVSEGAFTYRDRLITLAASGGHAAAERALAGSRHA